MKKFFKKNKAEKIFVIVFLSILLLPLVVNILKYKANHKFDDAKVIGHTEKEIAELYGNSNWIIDHKENEYIIDGNVITKIIHYRSGEKRDIFGGYQYEIWYAIYLDKNGLAVKVKYQNVP